eukprot:scaffold14074_cov111-Isochrysis_galbana.AAC.3
MIRRCKDRAWNVKTWEGTKEEPNGKTKQTTQAKVTGTGRLSSGGTTRATGAWILSSSSASGEEEPCSRRPCRAVRPSYALDRVEGVKTEGVKTDCRSCRVSRSARWLDGTREWAMSLGGASVTWQAASAGTEARASSQRAAAQECDGQSDTAGGAPHPSRVERRYRPPSAGITVRPSGGAEPPHRYCSAALARPGAPEVEAGGAPPPPRYCSAAPPHDRYCSAAPPPDRYCSAAPPKKPSRVPKRTGCAAPMALSGRRICTSATMAAAATCAACRPSAAEPR